VSIIWVDSGRFGTAAYDADAQARITAFEAADGQALETKTKEAVNQLVLAIKAASAWDIAAQLLLPCGPRTLEGALTPLKGPAPTNGTGSAGPSRFTSGNYNRKAGLGKASNTTSYLNSNVAVNSVGATSHALLAFGSMAQNSGDSILIGSYDGSNESQIITLDEWSDYLRGRAFRSAKFTPGQLPVVTSTLAATCVIGSRLSSTNATLYVDETSATNTSSATLALSSRSFAIYGINTNGTFVAANSSILQGIGIFSSGLNATQASALRSAFAAYVAAIAAAF